MSEKEYSNDFRLSLYQEDILLGEKTFSADQFNPFTRYSVDIRDILPRAISKIQKTLSKKSYSTQFYVGKNINNEDVNIDFFQSNLDIINSYPSEFIDSLKYTPRYSSEVIKMIDPITKECNEKTIKGVECKLGFYINDKTIVERVFYVDGFNIISRWSLDVIWVIDEITDKIFQLIQKNDIVNTWDDSTLINNYGFSINDVRLLSPYERRSYLKRLS